MTVSRPNITLVGTLSGIVAGIIDIVPMVFQRLTWDATLSALALWTIAGFMISTTELKLSGALKDIVISFLLLISMGVMTLILGGTLGYVVSRFGGTQ